MSVRHAGSATTGSARAPSGGGSSGSLRRGLKVSSRPVEDRGADVAFRPDSVTELAPIATSATLAAHPQRATRLQPRRDRARDARPHQPPKVAADSLLRRGQLRRAGLELETISRPRCTSEHVGKPHLTPRSISRVRSVGSSRPAKLSTLVQKRPGRQSIVEESGNLRLECELTGQHGHAPAAPWRFGAQPRGASPGDRDGSAAMRVRVGLRRVGTQITTQRPPGDRHGGDPELLAGKDQRLRCTTLPDLDHSFARGTTDVELRPGRDRQEVETGLAECLHGDETDVVAALEVRSEVITVNPQIPRWRLLERAMRADSLRHGTNSCRG